MPSASEFLPLDRDLEEIQSGLNALPNDLLVAIEALDARLRSIDSILASLLATATSSESLPAETSPVFYNGGSGGPSSVTQSDSSMTTSSEDFLASVLTSVASSLEAAATDSVSLASVSPQTTNGAAFPTTYYPIHVSEVPLGATTVSVTDSFAASYISPAASQITSYATTTTMHTTVSSAYTASATASALAAPITPPSANRTRYIFNPAASDNVAVYYGQTINTTIGGLGQLCQSPNVDIVILAFVNGFFAGGGYPRINFGPGCDPPNPAQQTKGPDLLNCPSLANQIKTCHAIGKPVLVSLGGYIATSAFSSDAQARQFATTLWNLFGGGTQTPHLRPFGSVKVDGFDLDNEDGSSAYYETFAGALRNLYARDKSKQYYLSAAPQCIFPDQSISQPVLAQVDFIWVQFYNNPSCNLDQSAEYRPAPTSTRFSGFESAFGQWSNAFRHTAGTIYKRDPPRIYIGAAGFPGAGSGYLPGSELKGAVQAVKGTAVNFGGIMLWDGTAARHNIDVDGKTYIQYAKGAVTE